MNNKRSPTLKQYKYHSDFMIGSTLAQMEVSDNILIIPFLSNNSFLKKTFILTKQFSSKFLKDFYSTKQNKCSPPL